MHGQWDLVRDNNLRRGDSIFMATAFLMCHPDRAELIDRYTRRNEHKFPPNITHTRLFVSDDVARSTCYLRFEGQEYWSQFEIGQERFINIETYRIQ